VNIDLIKIYSVSLELVSVWLILNEIKGEIFLTAVWLAPEVKDLYLK